MKSFWNIVGIVILAAVIAVGLYFIFRPTQSSAPATQTDQGSSQATNSGPGKKATKIYADTTHRFSFSYVSNMTVTGVASGSTYTKLWRQNTQTVGLLLATGIISKSAYPGTNFSEARFTIGESNGADALAECVTVNNGELAAGNATIGGIDFHKFTLSDAGAGNLYNTTSYRSIYNGRCVSVEYTIHSTNIGNYDPSQNVKPFDLSSVTADLETAVMSFAFSAPQDASSFLGKWTGVEGTSLTITPGTNGYNLKFIMLDGPVSATGTLKGDAVLFNRDSKPFALFHGTGDDTGMKYLLGKKDCIVVAPYEGYCKS